MEQQLFILNTSVGTNAKVTNYYDWYISGYNGSSPIAYKKDGKVTIKKPLQYILFKLKSIL